MNKSPPHSAISYARFSSGRQSRGSSIERQRAAFEHWLSAHADLYKARYLQDEGVSAYRGKNAAYGDLGRFLSLIEQKVIKAGDVLVVEAIDRLSRQSTIDSFDLIKEILRKGVKIITLENNQTYDAESLNGAAIYSLIASIQAAHEYSKRLGERVAASHEARRRKARAGEPIRNVVNAPWIKDGKLHEPFAGLVSAAVDFYLKGLGHREIVRMLQDQISANEILLARYGRLNATTVKKWLSDEALIGVWSTKGERIEGCFEPLISNIKWLQVREEQKRRIRQPSKSSEYVLSGIVFCGACGLTFHTRRQKPAATKAAPVGSEAYCQKKSILYCNCSGYLKNGTCSNGTTWPYSVLKYIYDYGLTTALADLYMKRDAAAPQATEELEDHIARLKIQQSREIDLYRVTADRAHLDTIAEYREKIEKLQAQKSDIEQRIASVYSVAGTIFDLSKIEKMPLLELRTLLKQMKYRVNVTGRVARLSSSPEGREIFTLVRRMQKIAKCYVLSIELPGMEFENSWIRYVAIGDDGSSIAESNSIQDLERSILQGGSVA